MKDILLLIRCELMKYSKLKIIQAGILSIIIVMGITTFNEYRGIQRYNANIIQGKEEKSWQEREEDTIRYATESLQDNWYNEIQREQLKRRIEVAKYNLSNDIPRYASKNMWWYFNDDSFNAMITFIVVITVLAGCINIGQEYSKKTINQMLLLPYNRYKILLAKYLAMLAYGIMLFSLLFILGIVSGVIIHGFEGINSIVVLHNTSEITTVSMTVYSLIVIFLKLIELVFFIALAGMVAVLFKSGAVASVVGILVALMGEPISLYLAKALPILNYSPLNNLDFRRYIDFGRTMPIINDDFISVVKEGITPLKSGIVVTISIVLILTLTFIVFERSDVK